MEGEMDNVALIVLQNNLQWYRYKIKKKNKFALVPIQND